MLAKGDRVDVVLDVAEQEDGSYGITVVGVYEPDQVAPPVPDGVRRNRVQTFLGHELNIRAFSVWQD